MEDVDLGGHVPGARHITPRPGRSTCLRAGQGDTRSLLAWCLPGNHGRLRPARSSHTILDITERSAHGIVTDLTAAGYVVKQKDGRRNRYQIQAHLPLPEPAISDVLALLAAPARDCSRPGPGQPEATAAERACVHPGRRPAPGSPGRLIRPEVRDGPGHWRPSRPGPFLKRTEAPILSPSLSGEPGIASVPAPRATPRDCSPLAASRLVTGLSRVSGRGASGPAVLTGTGRRAPVARLLRITGLGRQIGIFSHCPGRCHRPGGWPTPAFRRSGRRRRHGLCPHRANLGRRRMRRIRPARRRRRRSLPGSRRLQPARAAGWPPVRSRCRGGLACRRH
jgi:hypothetical protein